MARKAVDDKNGEEVTEELQPQKEVLYKFQRKYGKHHLRAPGGVVIIKPGDIIEAPKGSYVGNQWECLGPVEPVSEEPETPSVPDFEGFVKEQRKDGFYVINPKTNEALNTEPVTEEEADRIVLASTQHS